MTAHGSVQLLRTWVLTICACACQPSGAEPQSATTLHALCRAYVTEPASPDGARCASYVQGFLDGAGVGLEAGRTDVPGKPDESWTERAARTRLGKLAMQRLHEERAARFCLDDAVPLTDVIGRLLQHFEAEPPGPATTAAEATRRALPRAFPCMDTRAEGASEPHPP